MTVYFTLLDLPLLATAFVCLVLGIAALRRRGVYGAVSFFFLMLTITLYAVTYACELSSETIPAAMSWVRAEYLGFTLTPLFSWVFALQYGRLQQWVKRTVPILAVFPAFFIMAAWIPRLRHLLWISVSAAPRTASWEPLMLEKTYGPLQIFVSLYIFGLTIAAGVILLARISRSRQYHGSKVAAIVVAILAPLVGNLIFRLHLTRIPYLDWSALALGISGIALFWATFHYGLFNFAPLANRELVQHMTDAVIVLDTENHIISLNPSAERVLASPSRSVQDREAETVLQRWPGLSEWTAAATPGMREIGGPPWFEARLSHITTGNDTIVGSLLVLHDITQRRHLEERLTEMAHHDELTGLPNRTLFDDRLDQALKLSSRTGNGVGLLFLDLDHFKNVNDTQGHHTGDAYLKETARRLLQAVRVTDTVARLGGDEFVVLLPDCPAPRAVAMVAQKIVLELGQPVIIEGLTIPCSTSVGTVWSPADGAEANLLLQHADTAMYRAKADGGNTWRSWTAETPD